MVRFSLKTALAVAVAVAALRPGGLAGDEQALRWETRIPEGLKRARSENRLVLVDFWRDQCPWCVRLERETLVDERVLKALGEVVAVKAKNTDHPKEIQEYGVDGYPTVALLDPDGRAIDTYAGYMAADPFLAWLQSSRDRHLRLSSLKERIRKDPGDLKALIDLGKLHSGDGKWEDARKCLEEVLRGDAGGKRRESGEAHLQIGLTWKRSREYARALDSFQKARKIALVLLAGPRAGGKEVGAPAAAGKEAGGPAPVGPAVGTPPRASEDLDLLDRVLHETAVTQVLLGKREALIETLEEYDAKVSIPDARRHSWVLLQLGEAKKRAGALEEARRAFSRCDELYPRSSEARQCREELAALR